MQNYTCKRYLEEKKVRSKSVIQGHINGFTPEGSLAVMKAPEKSLVVNHWNDFLQSWKDIFIIFEKVC